LAFPKFVETVAAWVRFKRLYRTLKRDEGFLEGAVAFVSGHRLINYSIWSSTTAMLIWSGSLEHVKAVRSTYGHVRHHSTQFWQPLRHEPNSKLPAIPIELASRDG
jgi:hypothetical protein